jgi:hypothetical protein
VVVVRTATARGKAELADIAADHAREDSDIARTTAKQFAPDFQQPGNASDPTNGYNRFQKGATTYIPGTENMLRIFPVAFWLHELLIH